MRSPFSNSRRHQILGKRSEFISNPCLWYATIQSAKDSKIYAFRLILSFQDIWMAWMINPSYTHYFLSPFLIPGINGSPTCQGLRRRGAAWVQPVPKVVARYRLVWYDLPKVNPDFWFCPDLLGILVIIHQWPKGINCAGLRGKRRGGAALGIGGSGDVGGGRDETGSWGKWQQLPSGQHTKSYEKSPFLMGKSTINGDLC